MIHKARILLKSQLRLMPSPHYNLKRLTGRELGSVSNVCLESLDPLVEANSVLIYSERYFDVHTGWKLTIGKTLQRAGYRVITVGC